jgi:splicing factor 3B subunit 1
MGDNRSKAVAKDGSNAEATRFDGGVSLSGISYDKDLYTHDKSQYLETASGDDEDDYDPMPSTRALVRNTNYQTNLQIGSYGPTKEMREEFADDGVGPPSIDALLERQDARTIRARESDYQRRGREARVLTPTRIDAFSKNADEGQSYRQVMERQELEREEDRVYREIEKKKREGGAESDKENRSATPPAEPSSGRKRRWDVKEESAPPTTSQWTEDEKPVKKRSRWDQTPAAGGATDGVKTSRWDVATPVTSGSGFGATPTPGAFVTPSFGTDIRAPQVFLSDEELDDLIPKDGYAILEPPAGYAPIRHPTKKLMATPTADGGFVMQEVNYAATQKMAEQLPTDIPGVGELDHFKESDMKYFGKLLDGSDDADLSHADLKERKILRLLLKMKNGTPQLRKSALRMLTDNARIFGAKALFQNILPLLMERTLEDQERHLLVKVIDRVLYKLDDLVRPWVHKILVVIEPLLIDEDYYARIEGREIISNLAKAAGLAHMISTMRPDIDNADEYVRNTTARAFSVVASALGVGSLLPFLKAVCRSRKSWQARHTGVKIVQQIAILMGCSILPHLKSLVECIAPNLEDEQQKVRTITALALSALAEAATPYGIESFDPVLRPLWISVRRTRGKNLAATLRAVGQIIPLMNEEYAEYYTKEVMVILIREFNTPDEEMKKIVLGCIKSCAKTDGVTPQYLRKEVLPEFFKAFWIRRMALDRRNYRQVVETTVELSLKVGVTEIVERIVTGLKDESEAFRKMAMETIEKVVAGLGAADISESLEERLIDGVLFAFQEQSVEDIVMLNGFGTVINALGTRTKAYLPQISSTVLWRLNNKNANVRKQSADVVSRIAVVMKQCDEEAMLQKLGVVLYEYLGEEYPEVLASILGALKSIVSVVGMASMTPPIKDLLPRLTPILRNRHERVQENSIDLVGRIADRGAEFVGAREWMRICFELVDMLKAHKKGIRRAAVNTFGYVAKAIGPSDVLATLLNNLRVQERQMRVCTAVAIAIVAETCAPFTTLPAVMNEYRVPEGNVKTGCLKAFAFIFEYIGELAKDYIYAIVPLMEDALTDRDQVLRQTSSTVISHMALGCVGLGCEDALINLLNFLWPNIFETSPHLINAILAGIGGIRTAVGPGVLMNYLGPGLFHPARKIREVYWKMYNEAYVQQADSMVPYYADFAAEDKEYQRVDMYITI